MRVTIQLPKGGSDAVGKPVYKGTNKDDVFGTIIEYNPETGETILELDENKLQNDADINPYLGKPVFVSSRKVDEK